MKVYPYGEIDISTKVMGTSKVNRLKHYLLGEPIKGKVSYNLKRVLFWEAP